MSINRRMDKQIVIFVIHPYNTILLSNKKKQTTNTCNNVNEFQKYVERKKADTKEHMLKVSIR